MPLVPPTFLDDVYNASHRPAKFRGETAGLQRIERLGLVLLHLGKEFGGIGARVLDRLPCPIRGFV